MADTSVAITAGAGTPVDTRTEATNGDHRQVIVIGDPSVNAGVAPVDSVKGLTVNPLGYFATCSTDITRPADVAAYVANDALSNSTSAPTSGGFTFTGAGRASGKSGMITDLWLASSNAVGAMQGEIWIFDTSVTAINDNAAFAISDAEIKTVVAKIPFLTVADTNNAGVHVQNLSIGYTCVGSADLRFLVKLKAAYTPANAEVTTVRIKCLQVD